MYTDVKEFLPELKALEKTQNIVSFFHAKNQYAAGYYSRLLSEA